jgi:hypothetical protein
MPTQSTKEDRVGSRLPIYFQVLGEASWVYGKDQPDLRRYAESLCPKVWKKLGQESALCGILIQQRLPSQHRDGTIQSIIWTIVSNSFVLESDRRKSDVEKQVQIIRESLKVAQTRQKSYTDKRRRDLSFEIGDFVYLKVPPMRGTCRFKVKGKLAPRYVGPFKVIDRKGEVPYQLELPPQLSDVHDVFHVSKRKKCLRVPKEQLPME